MDNFEIQILPMTEADIDEVYELGLNEEYLRIRKDNPMMYSKDSLINAIHSPRHICLVAKVNGQFAGFRLAQMDLELGDTYLSDIVIKEEFRGKGVGRKLFETSINILKDKGSDWMWAMVHEDNLKMQKFLEKQGFTQGRKFYFYYKGED